MHESGRVRYVPITDQQALEAFQLCCQLEGIIPALESAHALAALPELTARLDEGQYSSSMSLAAVTTTYSR